MGAIAERSRRQPGKLPGVSISEGNYYSISGQLERPERGYVAKLGFVCSPSVITGDPVASNSAIVSRSAIA